MSKNLLDTFPSTLPPDFIPRILKQLLPDPESLDPERLREWHRLRLQYERVIKANPLKFFSPNEGGQREFMECEDPEIQGMYFFAGNKTGKTTGALIKFIERMAGQAMWGLDRRAHIKYPAPVLGAMFCEDFDTHRTDLLPRFFTWCPKSILKDNPLEEENGEPARILFKNGSVVVLRTYQQGYKKHEGKDYHVVLMNEPCSRDIYTGVWRGFTATDGIMFIAATLLSEVWLYDEMQQPFIKVFDADTFQNKWLSQRTLRNWFSTLDESEKQVRIYGRSQNLSGRIYPQFKDALPHVVANEFPQKDGTLGAYPWDVVKDNPYPIVMAVDPHERKPLCVAWAYVTPFREIIWFDWLLAGPASAGLDVIFEQLREKELSHHHACSLVIMDPNRGIAIQKDGRCWRDEFEERDYPVQLGDDDINIGHAAVAELLRGDFPRMRWTERCRGKDGPVWQMLRYQWDEWVRGGFQERDIKERPKDLNKDFPDLCRYIALAKLDYHLLLGEKNGVLRLNGGSGNPYTDKRSPSAIYAEHRYRRV